MDPKSAIAPSSLLCITFFLLFTSATCFNITRLFNTYPDFSTYNSYLTQTHLAEEINKRQTITVLAVTNSAISQISGKSIDDIKKILSLHVVLDYFDEAKLEKLSKKSALLTTLFQSSGEAMGQQGFINVTDKSSGEIAFGPAVKGASLNANLIRKIAAQPYNISVLEISALIIPEGLSAGTKNKTNSSPPSPAPVAAPKKSPAPAPSKDSPAKAPAPSDAADAPAPADGPADADAPAPADGPADDADSSLSSPPMPADGPADADSPAALGPSSEKPKSGSTSVGLGLIGVVSMVVVSSLATL